MGAIFFIVAFIYTVYVLIREKVAKPICPKGARFDWDAYWKDIENGIEPMEQIKKREKGGYYTTEPENDLVDIDRYNKHLQQFGQEVAEKWRKQGFYKYK